MTPEFREIALDTLFISPYNVRRDPGDLTELTDSITIMDVLEPILVRPMGEGYEVIAGSRRARAAQEAGLTTIPARVLELTAVQAILTSLIENIQRKDLTLAERVQTYQTLSQLDPEYQSHRSLAKVIGLSHQKITQDFQAYAVLLKLQPSGIRVASDLPPTAEERQQGTVLPEYHAVLIHQAMSYLVEVGVVAEEEADEQLVKLARLIAPLSQEAAEELITQVKAAGEQPAHLTLKRLAEELVPFRQFNAGRHGAARRRKSAAKVVQDGGVVTCACCNRVLQLNHRADGTHTVTDTPFTGHPLLPAPALLDEPIAAARNPAPATSGRQTSAESAPATSDVAPALEALETPQPILKRTAGYTIESFPKGLHTILTPQTSGFWGRLTDSPANPDFTETDIPQSIWTADPWVGCLWGLS
jgi:ParB/RepB/Spo0J family partition protein